MVIDGHRLIETSFGNRANGEKKDIMVLVFVFGNKIVVEIL